MSNKRSRIHLYSADRLEEEALTITSVDDKLSFTSPNDFELSGPKFILSGQTNAQHDISDLGLYLKTLSDTQATDSTTQAAAIASLTTNLATLDAREQANHSAQATLLGTETARASAAEAVLQTNVDAEAASRASADTTLQSNINAEASARARSGRHVRPMASQSPAPTESGHHSAKPARGAGARGDVAAAAAVAAVAVAPSGQGAVLVRTHAKKPPVCVR